MELIAEKIVKARKEHRCTLCTYKIEKHEKYLRQTIVDDDIYDAKTHVKCNEVAHKLNMFEYEGLNESMFQEYIEDAYNSLSNGHKTSYKNQIDFVCNHYLK